MAYTLSELRAKRGLTQRQLAEALGLTDGAIANYELGSRVPRLPVVRMIATFFEVPIEELRFPGEVERTLPAGDGQPGAGDGQSREEAAS